MSHEARIYSDIIDDLVRDLTGANDARRVDAVDRCHGLPEDMLLEILSSVLIQHHRQVAWQRSAFVIGVIGAVSLAYLTQGEFAYVYGLIGIAIAYQITKRYRHTGRSLQALLDSSEDKRLIPILLIRYTAHDGSAHRHQHVRLRDRALTQLLPHVVASDSDLWSNAMRERMNALLRRPYRNVALSTAVITALAEIGDESSLPFIESVARRRPSGRAANPQVDPTSEYEELNQAALRCVAAIRKRAISRRDPAILLRPSNMNVPLDTNLLRIVNTGEETDASELLRSPLPAELRRTESGET